jgi:hypothetical protein
MKGYGQATGTMIKAVWEKGFKVPLFITNDDCPHDIVEMLGKEIAVPFFTCKQLF